MSTYTLHPTDLAHFTGTQQWFRHGLIRDVLYTEGAHYLAEHGGAYWLLDEIALAQSFTKEVQGQEFQAWTLTVTDTRATLTCDDGNGHVLYIKRIGYTDFPLPTIELWCVHNTIMLPSEY